MQKQKNNGGLFNAMKRARQFFSHKKYDPTQTLWHRIVGKGHLVKIKIEKSTLSVELIGTNAISLISSVAEEASEVKKHMQAQLGKVESVLDNNHGLKFLYFFYQPVTLEARLKFENEYADYFCTAYAGDKSGKSWGVHDVKNLEPTNLTDAISQIDTLKDSLK